MKTIKRSVVARDLKEGKEGRIGRGFLELGWKGKGNTWKLHFLLNFSET